MEYYLRFMYKFIDLDRARLEYREQFVNFLGHRYILLKRNIKNSTVDETFLLIKWTDIFYWSLNR